jgi:hypothetical protein
MLFFACLTAGIKIGYRAADWVILREVYGPTRVRLEKLSIVDVKPTLIVSNGDRLKSHAMKHFFITCAFFFVGMAGYLASHHLLPRSMNQALQHREPNPSRREGRSFMLAGIICLLLAIPLAILKPLWLNALVVALALAIAHLCRPDVRPSYRR